MINALITWNVVADTNEGIVLRHNISNSIVENYISRARSRGIKVSDTTRTMAPIVKYNFSRATTSRIAVSAWLPGPRPTPTGSRPISPTATSTTFSQGS